MNERRGRGDIFGLGLLAVGFAAYWLVFRDVLPRSDHLGADYSFFMPRLLAGHYHFVTNGPFHIPWFSPAQCGGLPFYADPQIPYFALPQLLAFSAGPTGGVVLSVYIMAAAGALGFYVLLRTRFKASPAASAAGGILFLFNGMYVARMGVGHLAFQPFVLAPWAAWAVLAPAGSVRWRLTRMVGAVVVTAIVFVIAFQAGMVHLLVPMGLTVAAVIAIHGGREGHSLRPWVLFGLGGVTTILLSLQRLAAAASYLAEFPRDYYPLPGFRSLVDGIAIPLWSLFWSSPGNAAFDRLANRGWYAAPHEWGFTVGPVAAVLLVAGAVVLVVRLARRGRGEQTAGRRTALAAAILLAIFIIPIAGNFYTPAWNAFLKELPLVSSTVLMIRWYAVYILPAALAAALALDLVLRNAAFRWAGAAIVLAATAAWNMSVDLGDLGVYDDDLIVAGWEQAQSPETVPPITDVAPQQIARDSGLAIGFSPVPCYQPMFGYQLETFPRKELEPGPALAVNRNGNLNVKNPACYVFPEANSCEPGDHFSEAERDKAELFLSYRNFPFERPLRQRIAGQINLWTPVALVLLLGTAIVLDRRRHVASGPGADEASTVTARNVEAKPATPTDPPKPT